MASLLDPKMVFMLGASSDIGKSLAERYVRDGRTVVGTYRNGDAVADLSGQAHIHLFQCDVGDAASVARMAREVESLGLYWDTFISCVGTMKPIGKFFDQEFDCWEDSLRVNATAQLRALHALHGSRDPEGVSNVVFMAGGGTNNPLTNFSAYCVSKIMLIKMCELLDDENEDLNVFIVGPGWVRTKIHQETLESGHSAGEGFEKTRAFLESGTAGTSNDDIYDCINWCIARGRGVSGGRNFSVVHDGWQTGGEVLAAQLQGDSHKFKLRRVSNNAG